MTADITNYHDFHAFNRLPRPSPLIPDNPSDEGLDAAFPFLFKPNRLLALHPDRRQSVEGLDFGHPSRDRTGGRVFRIPLKNNQNYIGLLSHDGDFSVWHYVNEESAHGLAPTGLHPVELLLPGHSQPCHIFNLREPLSEDDRKQFMENVPGFLLMALRRYVHSNGVLLELEFPAHRIFNLKLTIHRSPDTTGRHRLGLAYWMESGDPPVDESFSKQERQIGGWSEETPFFVWENEQRLYEGNPQDRLPSTFQPPFNPFRLRSVEKQGELTVGGGKSTTLWIQQGSAPIKTAQLREFVRQVGFGPADPAHPDRPLILVGCKDYCLYLCDAEGVILQKVFMDGYPDSFLLLGENREEQWADVAILVRQQGLYCCRIFLDRLKITAEFIPDKIDRENFSRLVCANLARLPDASAKATLFFFLKALLAVLESPEAGNIWLQTHLQQIPEFAVAFLAHAISRKIKRIVKKTTEIAPDDPVRLTHYLKLLQTMTTGHFIARMEVRALEGWLMSLVVELEKKSVFDDAIQAITDLSKALPDAKRLLRKLAKKNLSDRSTPQNGACIGLIGRLQHDRIFSELVFKNEQGGGPVRVLTAIRSPWVDPSEHTFVLFRQGQRVIGAFQLDIGEEHITPKSPAEEEGWREVTKDLGDFEILVRAILPLTPDAMIIVTENRVGYWQPNGKKKAAWSSPSNISLHCATIHQTPNCNWVVVAGEWRPENAMTSPQGAAMLYSIGREHGLRLHNTPILMPAPEWNNRIVLRKLAFDTRTGDLWCVTSVTGGLYRWPQAIACIERGQLVSAELVVKLASPQYCLAWMENQVVCGGADGILRAFDRTGALLWTFETPGAVREIKTVTPPEGPSYLATICEKEHLFVLDQEGCQKGMLFLPRSCLISLDVVLIPPKKRVHYLLGSLSGETRLVEELPSDWTPETYFSNRSPQTDNSQHSTEIVHQFKKYLTKTAGDPIILKQWCSMEQALQEPTRAAWSAGQLLTRQERKTVLKLLEKLNSHAGTPIDSPGHKRLRAMLFGEIGEHLGCFALQGAEEDWKRLLLLCDSVLDGALASLLVRLIQRKGPQEPSRKMVWDILEKSLAKAITGKPFSSSALCQFFTHLPENWKEMRDLFLVSLLDRLIKQGHTGKRLHIPLLEWVAAMVFRHLGVQDGALLPAFGRIPERLPHFAKYLDENNEAANRSKEMLDSLAGRLFSIHNRPVWRLLSDSMDKTSSVEKLRHLLTQTGESSLDRKFIQELMAILPDSEASQSDSNREVVFRDMTLITYDFFQDRQNLRTGNLKTVEKKRVLDGWDLSLEKKLPRFPMLGVFYRTWQAAWKTEQANLRHSHLPQTPLDYLHLEVEPLLTVPGEQAPLLLRLRNEGLANINDPLAFWVEKSSLRGHVEPESRFRVEKKDGLDLWVPGPDGKGEILELRFHLLPELLKEYSLEIGWSVGKEIKKVVRIVQTQERWTTFRALCPNRDRTISALFSAQDAERGFRYQRILILREMDKQSRTYFTRQELVLAVEEWAERSGRREGLKIFSPESDWPLAGYREAQEILANLQARPSSPLEIILADQSLSWGWALVNRMETAPGTALLLPSLMVEDAPVGRIPYPLQKQLDFLLSLHFPSGLSILQWALKACVQGTSWVDASRAHKLGPACLALPVEHGNKVWQRGETPTPAVWKDRSHTHWPVAGVRGASDWAALPLDPARPLAVLIPPVAFHALYWLGLVRRWGEIWVPRSPLLFQYVDTLFPTRIPPSSSPRKEGTEKWEGSRWTEGNELDMARQALFSRRGVDLDHIPYEGFSPEEWDLLHQHVTSSVPVHDHFFLFLGIANRKIFLDLHNSKRHWEGILRGESNLLAPLAQRFQSAGYQRESALTTFATGGQATLHLYRNPGFRGQLERLVLVMPDKTQLQALEKSPEDRTILLHGLLRECSSTLESIAPGWPQAIKLIPLRLNPGELANLRHAYQEAVFLDDRLLSRFMVARNPHSTLLAVIHSQISLAELGGRVFTLQGPVPVDRFFGRAASLARIVQGIKGGKSIIVTGPRAIGKSSLLQYFPHSDLWRNELATTFLPIALDLQEERIVLDDQDVLQQLAKTVGEAVGTAVAHTLLEEIATLGRRSTKEGHALAVHDGQVKTILGRVMEHLSNIAAPKRPLFLIDEADGYYMHDKKRGEAVFTIFRTWHNSRKAQFIFSAYPTQARKMAEASTKVAKQIFNFSELECLEPLGQPEGVALVQTSMGEVGLPISVPQAEKLVDESLGIPSVLQRACHELLRLLDAQNKTGVGRGLGAEIISQAMNKASTHFLNSILLEQVEPRYYRVALILLVQAGCNTFSLQQMHAILKKERSMDLPLEVIRERLDHFCTTLLLVPHDTLPDHFRFSGPLQRPYFPEMARRTYGSTLEEWAIEQLLKESFTSDQIGEIKT